MALAVPPRPSEPSWVWHTVGPLPADTALYHIATGSDWVLSRVLANASGPGHPRFGHRLVSVFERPFRVSGTASAMKQQ